MVGTLHAAVRKHVSPLAEDRPPADDLAAVRPLIADGTVAEIMRAAAR
jgi:histidine ammonia-lyase